MTEKNNPVDIGPAQIRSRKDAVEEILTGYRYGGKSRSLPELMLKLDPEEQYIMGPVEHDTYLAIREGMQIFSHIAELLSDKVGLKQKLISTPTAQLTNNPELDRLRDFCHTYATYAASRYGAKKLDALIRAQGVADSEKKADLHDLGITLDSAQPEAAVIKRLLAPIFAYLIQQEETGAAFETSLVFSVFVKDLFEKYAELAAEKKDAHPDMDVHLKGYTFRIMDDFLTLEGYEDRSLPPATAGTAPAFQPIRADEIVGNRNAKKKIIRYVDRLALYDFEAETNPILELGGLAWTSLYDGLPGTGKSSLFRLAMTRLKDLAEAVGFPYAVFTVDQSIKDEYYGKTGKILLQRLSVTQDAKVVSLGILDDIDLLTSSRDEGQGADNDITNILMQYLDGVYTVRRGNVINFAASNKPTGLDEALRNRFNDRLMIDGPNTSEDFADMVMIIGRKLVARGLIAIEKGYEPFSTQQQIGKSSNQSESLSRKKAGPFTETVEEKKKTDVAAYMAEEFAGRKKASLLDFGAFMADLKRKNRRITGRSAKAVVEAVKERSADFDVPEEWFSDRSLYYEKPYETRLAMVAELYRPITPDVLFQEAQRYFDSEQRFASTDAEEAVKKNYNRLMWDIQAQLRYYEEQLMDGEKGDLARYEGLKHRVQEMILESRKLVD